jgi:hypothetical protein
MSAADRHRGAGLLRKRRTSARSYPHALRCCVRFGPVQCRWRHDFMRRAWRAWQIRSTLRCAGVCGEDLERHRAGQHSSMWMPFSGAAERGRRSDSKLSLRRRRVVYMRLKGLWRDVQPAIDLDARASRTSSIFLTGPFLSRYSARSVSFGLGKPCEGGRYSCCSASMGSMRDARRAGTRHASAATASSTRDTTAAAGT